MQPTKDVSLPPTPKKGLSIRSVYSASIAVLPVIMIYNVPVFNIGLSTILLGLFIPYAGMCILRKETYAGAFPFLVLFSYFIVRSLGNWIEIFLLLVVLIHALGAARKSLDMSIVRETIEKVCILSTFCVLFQTLIHYALGVNVNLIIPEFVLSDLKYYFFKNAFGMYRPSGLFLEPAHYAQYCCIGLTSVLFPADDKKPSMKKALWILLGCLLTTSGMGIALCVGILAWHAFFSQPKDKRSSKLVSIVGWLLIGGCAFFLLMQISIFSLSVQRVFGEVDGYNAIWGRTLFWDVYIAPMRGRDLLLGYGTLAMPEAYFTGLMEIIYCYGYVGLGLLLMVYAYLFFKGKSGFVRCCCFLYCGIICVGNIFSLIGLSFWLCVICGSVEFSKKPKTKRGALI